jgi:multiple RNA-binding domain-containing protein 1
LKEHFSQRGDVTDVRIIRNKQTGESRQFGYIGYSSEKQAKEALKYFNNSYLDTRKLEVSIAKAVSTIDHHSPTHLLPFDHFHYLRQEILD